MSERHEIFCDSINITDIEKLSFYMATYIFASIAMHKSLQGNSKENGEQYSIQEITLSTTRVNWDEF